MSDRPTDTLIIRDMVVDMFVGIHDFEKKKKQRVVINLEIGVAPNNGGQSDDIADVLSYADVVSDIESIADDRHINLVENFAEKIADAVLKYPQARHVQVRVEKPDIFPHIAGIGIEITRSR